MIIVIIWSLLGVFIFIPYFLVETESDLDDKEKIQIILWTILAGPLVWCLGALILSIILLNKGVNKLATAIEIYLRS